jgi:hypothetical protein
MTARSTFTWGDSYVESEHVGTVDVLEPILAAMLEAAETSGEVMGVSGMTVSGLLRRLTSGEAFLPRDPTARLRREPLTTTSRLRCMDPST